MKLKENEMLASAVQGHNHMMYVSTENVIVFSPDKVVALERGAC